MCMFQFQVGGIVLFLPGLFWLPTLNLPLRSQSPRWKHRHQPSSWFDAKPLQPGCLGRQLKANSPLELDTVLLDLSFQFRLVMLWQFWPSTQKPYSDVVEELEHDLPLLPSVSSNDILTSFLTCFNSFWIDKLLYNIFVIFSQLLKLLLASFKSSTGINHWFLDPTFCSTVDFFFHLAHYVPHFFPPWMSSTNFPSSLSSWNLTSWISNFFDQF